MTQETRVVWTLIKEFFTKFCLMNINLISILNDTKPTIKVIHLK